MKSDVKDGIIKALTMLIHDEEICETCKDRIILVKCMLEENQVAELRQVLGIPI